MLDRLRKHVISKTLDRKVETLFDNNAAVDRLSGETFEMEVIYGADGDDCTT